MPPCCAHMGDFCESMRPSFRWVLLTRILFVSQRSSGQQTREHPLRWVEFLLCARLLIPSDAREFDLLRPSVQLNSVQEVHDE